MTDEALQTEVASESQEIEAGLAPDTGEGLDENTTVETQSVDGEGEQSEGQTGNDPAGYTKAINKKHYELMEERRRADAAEQNLRQLQSQIPQEQRPVVPEKPDPYDSDYDQRMVERDNAILKAAQFDARAQVNYEQNQIAEQVELNRQQEESVQRGQEFTAKAVTLGITEADLSTSLSAINSLGGVSLELSSHILEDESGPAIVKYLSQDVATLLAIQSMSPMAGAVYLEKVVKPKLAAQSNTSSAPSPADSLNGGGTNPSGRGPKGARYE